MGSKNKVSMELDEEAGRQFDEAQFDEATKGVRPAFWVALTRHSLFLFRVNLGLPVLLPIVVGTATWVLVWFCVCLIFHQDEMDIYLGLLAGAGCGIYVLYRLLAANVKMFKAFEDAEKGSGKG